MAAIKKYVRFYVQSRRKWVEQKPKPRAIVLSFAYQGKVLSMSTGINALASDWDTKKQRVKTSVKRAAEVNTYLDRIESRINDIYFAGLAAGDEIDNKYIMDRLKHSDKKGLPEPVKVLMLDEWTKYLDIHEQKFQKSTIKGMRAVRDKFERYCKNRKIRPTFDDIKTPLLADYVKYLLDIGNTNNTISTAIKRMKIFMSYALKAGLHSNNQYNGYNLSEKVGRLNYLEWSEVKKLIDLKIDDAYDNDIRNVFLIGCLTAMRSGDILDLQKDSIKSLTFDGVDGNMPALHFRQKKTDKIQTIPLLPEAYNIFNQYTNTEGTAAMPRVTRNEVNHYIKKIGKAAGLTNKVAIDIYRGDKRETVYKEKWEILSTHLGRHTFISVAASRGIPMHIVAEIAGQNPKTTMRHYAGIIDREKFLGVLNKMKFDDKKQSET